MFRELRRKDRSMPEDRALDILKEGKYGVLSTIGQDGYPYGTPVNYVYLDSNIYFHCALKGHKVDNICSNNKVSFCVVGNVSMQPEKFTTKYESVIVFGRAYKVEGEEKKQALSAIVYKYSSEYKREGEKLIKNQWDVTNIVRIQIEHISGKNNINSK